MLINSYVGKMQYCKDYVGLVQYLCVGQVHFPTFSLKSAIFFYNWSNYFHPGANAVLSRMGVRTHNQ